MNGAPIVIVDDDTDDRELLHDAWCELDFNNPLIFLSNGDEVLHHLKTEKVSPFLILCDVNIPGMDGFELKAKILQDQALNYKSIPFIFWSSQASKMQIRKAYDPGGNGFFLKEVSFESLKQSLIDIVKYWLKSKVPE